MLTSMPSGLYQSSQLSKISGVVHGYSTRQMGDMRTLSIRDTVLKALGLRAPLVMGEQVHGTGVQAIGDTMHVEIPGIDGLVVAHKHVPIAVVVADCVPLLLADPKKGIVGAVHAGWRGTIANITAKAISQMVALGSSAADIVVSIGPHIGMCCYTVPKERVDQFVLLFGTDPKIASFYDNAWHLDIGWSNYRQLIDVGIKPGNIDAPPVCTSCQVGLFYSYRKDTKESFGELLGIIARV